MRQDAPPPEEKQLVARSPDNDGLRLGILSDFVGFHLRLAYEETFQDFVDELGPDSLTPGSFALMSLIHENPGVTQTELSRSAGRDKSSVTIALRLLEDQDLIVRRRLDDRRSYTSELTAKGRRQYDRILAKARIHADRVERILGKERQAEILETLRTLIVALRAHRD